MKRSWRLYGDIFICACPKIIDVVCIQRPRNFLGRVVTPPAEHKMRMCFDITPFGAKGDPWPQLS
jgi:hypothetical protein